MKLEDIKKNISKEEFENLYCDQFLSKKKLENTLIFAILPYKNSLKNGI